MKCAFCGSDTDERYNQRNITVFAHFWCLEDRMRDMDTTDWTKCLEYEDWIRDEGKREKA
jgi:hypothetical protein